MSARVDAIVLGAGVVGVTTAYALASRGVSVTIVDREPEAGRGTSYANGAQLSYTYTDALAAPALLARLPWLALASDPAFRLRPSVDPEFLRWGFRFLRNATNARFSANTIAGLRLAIESRLAMHRLLKRFQLDFGHAVPGKIHIYDERSAFAAAARTVALKRTAGANQQLLTPHEAAEIEPALRGVAKRIVGAVYSPDEEVGDPYRFCGALLDRLRTEYDVGTRFGTSVARMEFAGGKPSVVDDAGERIEATWLVVCTGVDAPQLLRGCGIRVSVWPMKGHSLTAIPGTEAPTVSITDVSRKIVFCKLSGRMRIAGLADLGNRTKGVDQRRLDTMINTAKRSLPNAVDYDRIESTWSGLRPMTPNSLPIIKSMPNGLAINVGHGALGWTYAMGAAERVAALMLDPRC